MGSNASIMWVDLNFSLTNCVIWCKFAHQNNSTFNKVCGEQLPRGSDVVWTLKGEYLPILDTDWQIGSWWTKFASLVDEQNTEL